MRSSNKLSVSNIIKYKLKSDIPVKIQDLSEEYRKKVELFNLLEELYKSMANLKPMKFKMDDCVSVLEKFIMSCTGLENI
jgi:hypothetical protein